MGCAVLSAGAKEGKGIGGPLGYAKFAMEVWCDHVLTVEVSGYPSASWEGRAQMNSALTEVKPSEIQRRKRHGLPLTPPAQTRGSGSRIPHGVESLENRLANDVMRALGLLPFRTREVLQIEYVLDRLPVAVRAEEAKVSVSQYWVEHRAGMWFLAGRLSAMGEKAA